MWDPSTAVPARMTDCFAKFPVCTAYDKHDSGLGCSVEVSQSTKAGEAIASGASTPHVFGSGHTGCASASSLDGESALSSCKDIFDDYADIWNQGESTEFADFYARKSEYSLKYTAEDKSGNQAESVIYNVEFKDTTPCEVASFGADVTVPSGAYPYQQLTDLDSSVSPANYNLLNFWTTTATDRGYHYCKGTDCLTGTDADISSRLAYKYTINQGTPTTYTQSSFPARVPNMDGACRGGCSYTLEAEANDDSDNTCSDSITVTIEDHQFPQHVVYPTKLDEVVAADLPLKKIIGLDSITTHDAAYSYNLYRTAGGFDGTSNTKNSALFQPPVVGFKADGAYTAVDYCDLNGETTCSGDEVTSGVTAHSIFAQVKAGTTQVEDPASASEYTASLHTLTTTTNTLSTSVECSLRLLGAIGSPSGAVTAADLKGDRAWSNTFDSAQHSTYTVPGYGCKDETFTPSVGTHGNQVLETDVSSQNAWDPVQFSVTDAGWDPNAGTGDVIYEAYGCAIDGSAGSVPSIRRTIGVVDTLAPTLNIFSEFRMCVDISADSAESGGIEEAKWDELPAKWDPTTHPDTVQSGDGSDAAKTNCMYGNNRQFGEDSGDANDGYDPAHTFTGGIDDYTIQHSAGYQKDMYFINSLTEAYVGYWCTDLCEGDLTNSVQTEWFYHNEITPETDPGCTGDMEGSVADFDSYEVGYYILRYTCDDSSENSPAARKCRTVVNEDRSKPVLAVLGFDSMTLEATINGNYVDDGATCSDRIDGMISQNVEVSGDVVNLANTDTYYITYRCDDAAGHEAWPLTRTVYVRDSGCPVCNVGADSQEITREVSFPYTSITHDVTCSDFLDGSSDDLDANDEPKIAIVPKMLIEPYGSTPADAAAPSYDDLIAGTATGFRTPFFPASEQVTGSYEITYMAMDANDNWNYEASPCTEELVNAGTYCGAPCVNSEEVAAQKNIRTVHIKDTLRPVITLTTADGTKFHGNSDEGEDTGINHDDAAASGTDNDQPNSAYHGGAWDQQPVHGSNPNMGNTDTRRLMAEKTMTTASTNGWIIGAVASALTGLALLAYSMKKKVSNVATSVPV